MGCFTSKEGPVSEQGPAKSDVDTSALRAAVGSVESVSTEVVERYSQKSTEVVEPIHEASYLTVSTADSTLSPVSEISPSLSAPSLSSTVADFAIKYLTGDVGEDEALSQITRGSVIEMTRRNALAYLPFFMDVVKNVNAEHGEFIEYTPTEFIDDYGRVTYFIVRLGADLLPQFIPGTPMFQSGVYEKSRLEVQAKGCQQNGPVLGKGCALFLCEFHCKLASRYEHVCVERKLAIRQRNPDCVLQALEDTLPNYHLSDANEHGRLIEMMDAYTRLIQSTPADSQRRIQSYCMLKDLAVRDGIQGNVSPAAAQKILLQPVQTHEFSMLMQSRQDEMTYPKFRDVFDGAESPEDLIRTLAEGFISKQLFVAKDGDGRVLDAQAQETNTAGVREMCEQVLKVIRAVTKNPTRKSSWAGLTSQQRNQQMFDKYVSENELVQSYAENLRELLQALFGVAGIMPAGMVEPSRARVTDPRSAALQALRQVLPLVETIFEGAGDAPKALNEQQLLDRLSRINALVSDRKEMVARELTVRLTLARRCFLARITKDDLRDLIGVPSIDLKERLDLIASNLGLTSPQPEVLLARVDYKIVEACMICIPDKKVASFKIKSDHDERCLDIIDVVVQSFRGIQRVSTVSDPPQHDEIIIPYHRPSEALDESLFNDERYKHLLPRMWMKPPNQILADWERYMINRLNALDATDFLELMKIADPLSPRRRKLGELLDRAAAARQPDTILDMFRCRFSFQS